MENLQVKTHLCFIKIYQKFSLVYMCNDIVVLFSDIVGEKWADSPLSMLPIYKELIAAGLRIWVFRYI